MVKLAVFGLGHLGKIHLRCLDQLRHLFEVVGLYDANLATAQALGQQYQWPVWDNPQALMQAAQAISIVTPTPSHYDLALQALSLGLHVFVEKPITHTLEQAWHLVEYAQTQGCYLQVGHVERFNPAFLAVQNLEVQPKFIEAHRLASFHTRGTEVSVVLDLMIHDLDLILKLVASPVVQIQANGVAVLSQEADIANARLNFANGAVANVTASRISLNPMRKMRLFQDNAYLSLDFLQKQAQVIRLYREEPQNLSSGQVLAWDLPNQQGQGYLHLDMPEIAENNAIRDELASFAQSILHGQAPAVSGLEATQALDLAWRIESALQEHWQRFGPQTFQAV